MVEWANRETPGIDGRRATAAFIDYWKARPGAGGRKVDWSATWRTWMRREFEGQYETRRPTRNGRRTADDKIAELQALKSQPRALPGGGW